jgi:hypothetical protein
MKTCKSFQLQQKRYEEIRRDWYINKGITNNTRLVSVSIEYASGFNLSEVQDADYSNVLNILNKNINGIEAEIIWPEWEKTLVEKALHEYQHRINKVNTNISPLAKDLCIKYCGFFGDRNKHGPDFFQAIVEKSCYFKMLPEELVKCLYVI